MKSNIIAVCFALATLSVLSAGCSHSATQDQKQKDAAAVEARKENLDSVRQNSHIPDWVKARMGATSQASTN